MEHQPTTNPEQTTGQQPAFNKEKVMEFYKKGLPTIVKKIFTEPIQGTAAILSEKSETSYFNSVVLICTTMLLYILIPYLALGDMRQYVGFSTLIKLGLLMGLFLVIITLLVFLIKSISGKPVFKNELLTGALCGIPTSVIIIVIGLIAMVSKDVNLSSFSMGDYDNLKDLGLIVGLVLFYMLLMLFNIVQQSLKSAGTNDAMSWYLSPLVIIVSIYLLQVIAKSFFK